MTRALTASPRIRRNRSALAAVIGIVTLFTRRRRERCNLARLDLHLLRDIGLDTDAAAQECAKPFWRP